MPDGRPNALRQRRTMLRLGLVVAMAAALVASLTVLEDDAASLVLATTMGAWFGIELHGEQDRGSRRLLVVGLACAAFLAVGSAVALLG